jgi:hypothetical protein
MLESAIVPCWDRRRAMLKIAPLHAENGGVAY